MTSIHTDAPNTNCQGGMWCRCPKSTPCYPATVNYIDALARRIGELAHSSSDIALLRLYALLALTKGQNTTLRDVHDAWAVWRAATRPDHPSLVPFEALDQQEQERDRPYAEAICAAAAELRGH